MVLYFRRLALLLILTSPVVCNVQHDSLFLSVALAGTFPSLFKPVVADLGRVLESDLYW